METVLRTQGLCKHYRRFQALDGLDMEVPKGAIYGLVGKNGAGKTTLIRVVCGLQAPTAGSYSLYGATLGEAKLNRARRRMGAVVETPSLYPDMTAEQNLKLQYRVLGLPDDGGIPELLELVGLSNTGRKKAGHFSLGMKQRLGIAIALCGDPDFLVLDEPINGLDPQGIVEMRELILKLNRERQITVLISSHITSDLEKLADYIVFLHQGRVVFEKPKDELRYGWGMLRCGEARLRTLDPADIVAWRRQDYECEVLVCDRDAARKKYPDALIDPATIDEIMLMHIRGEKP